MLVIGEGSYTTEKAYLKHFMSSEYPYCLKFGNSGGYTDPAQIFKELHIVFNTMIGDAHEEKDCAFALVDLDCSKEKAEQI